MKVSGKYFYGNEISRYGQENHRVDYGTLAKAFDAVLNNDIMGLTEQAGIGYWEQESGFVDHSEEIEELEAKIEELEDSLDGLTDDEKYKVEMKINELQEEVDDLRDSEGFLPEVFQYFIVSDGGAEILKEIDQIVWYNDALDMYVWGVTHYGTAWDYVLTDIECCTKEE